MPDLVIEVATRDDLAAIRGVYDDARAFQRAQGSLLWLDFGDESILGQIDAGMLCRVMHGDDFAGVFTVAYEDPLLWGDRDRGEHIYLHRIARAASFTGRGLVAAVIEWARAHCRAIGRRGLRMDTWASNDALLAFYARFGFEVVGHVRPGPDPRLSPHYIGTELALLEERGAETEWPGRDGLS